MDAKTTALIVASIAVLAVFIYALIPQEPASEEDLADEAPDEEQPPVSDEQPEPDREDYLQDVEDYLEELDNDTAATASDSEDHLGDVGGMLEELEGT